VIAFPPFRLDVDEQQLWRGDKLLALRKKPFAILRYLIQHPRRLVTQDELVGAVWSGTVVSDSAVRSHLHELRQVLGDGVIETVIGRGYRFVAELGAAPAAAPVVSRPERVVVCRAAELAVLRGALDRASAGRRQICFVSGEPGIGKTTLLDVFIDELEDRGTLVVRGHCVEQFGTPEAYLAMIEVIGALRRSERGDRILHAFVRYAPTFLSKLPQLVPDELAEEVTARAAGGTEARMVRELAEALEVACVDDPIVIVLEDLQWSDVATIDLLGLIAQRTQFAKLLVVGTTRRAAVHDAEHPLSRVVKTLVARSGAAHLALGQIPVEGVRELVALRFADHAFPPALIEVLAQVSGGTPLFLVTLLDDLVARGMLARRERWELAVPIAEVAAYRPDGIKQLIDLQLDRLTDDEQRTLEAASLVGATFDTGRVAAALGVETIVVDDRCDELVRRGLFLRREASEDAPDGTPMSRYGMSHALVQEVCEQRSSPGRRMRWHLAIAEYLERGYAGRTHEIAHVIAPHYEKAGVLPRAIDHYLVAAQQTALRFASADSVAFYERARSLLMRLPRSRERDARELEILAITGQLMIRTPYTGMDPLAVYERALELAREIGDAPNEYAALANLALRRAIHAELDLAAKLGDDLLALEAKHAIDPLLVEYGTNVRAFVASYRGEIRESLRLFEALLDSTTRANGGTSPIHPTAMLGPIARTALSRSYCALSYCYLGDTERAVREAQRAVEDALAIDDPLALGITENMLARIHVVRGAPPEVAEAAARVVLARGTAGGVVIEECKLVVQWAEAHRAPLDRAAANSILAAFRARVARRSLGASNLGPMVATTMWVSGHHADARAVVDEAIAYARAHREEQTLAELLILRGDYAGDAAAYREALDEATRRGIDLVVARAQERLR
jgi:tetratricopeptide (TPR) repeat protein